MDNTAKQVEQFDNHTKQALETLFRRKDVSGDGVLDPDELAECLYIMGINPTEEDIEFFLKNFDRNNDGKLQIEELMENVHVLYAHSTYREDLVSAFGAIDRNGDGYIRFTELYEILTYNGFMTGDQARKVVSEMGKFDKNMDGKFTYAEFVEMFLSKEYSRSIVNQELE